MDALEERIGYRFGKRELLEEALTHPSLGNRRNNQRLEFLGDAVLGLIVTRLLFDMYPKEAEGELARRHAGLVCGDALAGVAREIGMGEHIFMASSEEVAGGRDNLTNLEDACEALIGALYLDGGLEAAERFIQTHWKEMARKVKTPPKDAKTALQEWAQARAMPLPLYTVTATEGPAHAPLFSVQVSLADARQATATAASKRAAEQEAARSLLEQLGEKP